MYPSGPFICILLPSVLARGGGIGHLGEGLTKATSDLSLEPLPAATFAFYVVFAVLGAYQTLQATFGIPEHSVGPIFPISLFLSALTFTTYNVLIAVYIGLAENQNVDPPDRPKFSDDYWIAVNVMEELVRVFLVSSTFAVLADSDKVLVTTPWVVRGIKFTFDALLTTAFLAMSMWWAGFLATGIGITRTNLPMAKNVHLISILLMVGATADIAFSSIVLCIREKRRRVDDHNITLLIALVISPCLILYALYPIIRLYVRISPMYLEQLGLADAIVKGIFPGFIILVYQEFGKLPLPDLHNDTETSAQVPKIAPE